MRLPARGGWADLSPGCQGGRGELHLDRADLHLNCLAGIAGAPAMSLPLATVDGAPLGLSVLAAPGADLDLTDLAVRLGAHRY